MTREIEDWLGGLGLERYAEAFEQQDIDWQVLPHLADADLKELGVSLGHRKILLAAISDLSVTATTHNHDNSAPMMKSGPSVVSRAQGREEQAERRHLCVLFCDMVGSTHLAQELDPEDMRQLLRGYQDRVAGAVSRYGGHLAQYLGDGVMAFFGWPTAYEDQAERAVRAGLEAIEAVQTLDAGAIGRIHCRVAIATGPVVVGDLSRAGRNEGAIAGETPNLAARLQGYAEADQLIISEATRDLVGSTFEIEDVGQQRVRGFGDGMRLFRVRGVRDVESRFDAARGESLSRFVGRVHERALILEKWEQAKAGEGQAVFISGEAGIGKSRLVRSLLEEIEAERHHRWQLQCSPYHPNSALFPVSQSLHRAIGLHINDTPDERIEKLRRLLRGSVSNLDIALPVFAELLSLDTRGRLPRLELTPQELKIRTLNALVDRCLLTAADAPLLLIIEDAHWIDPTTRELTEQVIARINQAPVLMLVTHRPEWDAGWAGLFGHVVPLNLNRLGRAQITELIEDVLGAQPDDLLVNEIAQRTDGVPMFVEELARSLLEQQDRGITATLEIPATLQGSLMARLDGLQPMAKELVQAAAVIGREFSTDVLASVCAQSRDALNVTLNELMAARLITKGGASENTYVFRHALIQDVAYQSLVRRNRQHYHASIARALESLGPDTPDAPPEIVAHHLSEAGEHETAMPYWERAGERALAQYANDEAVRHFERMVECAGLLPDESATRRSALGANLQLGRALFFAGRMQEAMAIFLHTIDRARTLGDSLAFANSALEFDEAEFLSNEQLDHSVVLLREALEMQGASDHRLRCHLLMRLSRAYTLLGDMALADSFGQEAIRIARAIGDDRALTEAMIIGFLVARSGFTPAQMQNRLGQLDELLSAVERLGDLTLVGRAYGLDYYVSAEFGERQRMDRRLKEQDEWAKQRGALLHLWIGRHGSAMQAILDGDFGKAETFAEEAFEMGRRIHDVHVEGVYGMQMFTIRREQGRLAEVAPVMKRLMDDGSDRASWRPGFALIASDLGFEDAARRIFDEIATEGFQVPRDAKRSTTLAYLSETASALADRKRAETLYGLLEPYRHMTISSGIMTVCYGAAGRYLGLLAELLGDWDTAETHFEQALELNQKMLAKPWIAHTQGDFARMLKKRGRPDDIHRADALLNEAWSAAQDLGMVALTNRLRKQHS